MRRILSFGLALTIGFVVLGIDVGESWQNNTITVGSAHAKRHHHKRRHHRRHRHHRPPASEM